MPTHHRFDYLEFPAVNLAATKQFFTTVFGFTFTDYGPEYTAFSHAGIDGGFYQSDGSSLAVKGALLAVLYSDDLAQTQAAIEAAGGKISKPVFTFPGGRRFHFIEPSGNELAVWTADD